MATCQLSQVTKGVPSARAAPHLISTLYFYFWGSALPQRYTVTKTVEGRDALPDLVLSPVDHLRGQQRKVPLLSAQ